jgi:hypothetical protein
MRLANRWASHPDPPQARLRLRATKPSDRRGTRPFSAAATSRAPAFRKEPRFPRSAHRHHEAMVPHARQPRPIGNKIRLSFFPNCNVQIAQRPAGRFRWLDSRPTAGSREGALSQARDAFRAGIERGICRSTRRTIGGDRNEVLVPGMQKWMITKLRVLNDLSRTAVGFSRSWGDDRREVRFVPVADR